jgi:hypothetical protein
MAISFFYDPSENTMSLSAHAIDPLAQVADTPGTAPGDARLDTEQRRIVDDAIAVLADTNIMSAFEYLRQHGIRAPVIERVLLEPRRRRTQA